MGVGALKWDDLASILHDCEQAQVLSHVERELARNAVIWLNRAAKHFDALSIS
jgi:hypothetical protein